jgi:hypothetical protein
LPLLAGSSLLHNPAPDVLTPEVLFKIAVLTWVFLPFVILVMWFARDRVNAGVSICLMIIFWIIITGAAAA